MVPLPLLSSSIALDHRPANDTTRAHHALPPRAPIARPAGVRRVCLALALEAHRGGALTATRHLFEGARATMGRGAGVLVFADAEETTLAEIDRGQFVVHVPEGARARAHRRAGRAELAGPGRRIVLEHGDRAVLELRGAATVHARVVAVEHHVPLELVAADRRSTRRTLLAASLYLALLVAAVVIGRPDGTEGTSGGHAVATRVAISARQ
ncbi:MAG: hypothetical protein WKG00_10985 [Polyangiaceae bacterium]